MSEIFDKIEQIYGGASMGAVYNLRLYYSLSESIKFVTATLDQKYKNNDSAEIPSLTDMLYQYQCDFATLKIHFEEMMTLYGGSDNQKKVEVLVQMVRDEDLRIAYERTKKMNLAKLEKFANGTE
jgi:hypothetical protein